MKRLLLTFERVLVFSKERETTPATTRLWRAMALCLVATVAGPTLGTNPANASEPDQLTLEVDARHDAGDGVEQATGTMRGRWTRHDGSTGTYAVPIALRYPRDGGCNGTAFADVANSVFYESSDSAGTASDPFFPSVFPLGRALLGDDFLARHRYVYAAAEWNKLVLDRQRGAGTLADASWHIGRGTDGYRILRDLSAVLRQPAAHLGGTSLPCASETVLAFGYSQSGMLLRDFAMTGRNATLADSAVFGAGLVFEGAVHAAVGARCREMTDSSPFFRYSSRGCGGATPARQGSVITVNTESDLQLFEGWRARPDDGDPDTSYRVYELAGVAHIPTSLLPLTALGLRDPQQAAQNAVGSGPTLRAAVERARQWMDQGRAPAASALLSGHVAQLPEPLFSGSGPGSGARFTFATRDGSDGNSLGGVRLPHMLTVLDDGHSVGAPIGAHRGTFCASDAAEGDFVTRCQLRGDAELYNMLGGSFVPWSSDQCGGSYPTRAAYVDAAAAGAADAVTRGWILPEDERALVQEAVARAEASGCIPSA